jgi:hypothetical protein
MLMHVGVIVNIRCDGDSDIRREFHEFKLQETAKKGKKQREDQVNELKSFSESLKVLLRVECRSIHICPCISKFKKWLSSFFSCIVVGCYFMHMSVLPDFLLLENLF